MATLSFKVATLNTALVRIEFFNIDVREAIPARLARRDALVQTLLTSEHDIICLQEVYSRPQQQWLARQLAGSKWHVIGSNLGALPGQRNWGLVTLLDKAKFRVTDSRYIVFPPADWTEFLIAPKGAMAHQVERIGVEPIGRERAFWLINLHTTYGGFNRPFAGPKALALRSKQLRMLGQQFADQTSLFVGDFNCGSYVSQPSYLVLLDEYGCTDVVNHKENHSDFRTWNPSNPLHHSILNRDGQVHDDNHGRLDHIIGSDGFNLHWHATMPKMIWDQSVVAANFPAVGDKTPLSDHYGLEVCISPK